MPARGARVMFDPSAMPRPAMSTETFAALGENRVAYIRAIRSEEVAFLCAEAPLLPAGHRVFVLHAADGTPIVLAHSLEPARAAAWQGGRRGGRGRVNRASCGGQGHGAGGARRAPAP